MSTGQIPQDDYGKPVLALWDDAAQKAIPVHIGSTVTGADGKTYAILDVNASVSVSPSSNQRVNAQSGDFVDGSIATIGAEANTAASSDTGTFTLMAFVKRLMQKLPNIGPQAKAASLSVTFATDIPKAGVTAASGDFADGAIVGIGTTTQTKATDGTVTSWSVIQLLKGIFDRLINGTVAVTGTFWQTTQPVSQGAGAAAGTSWRIAGDFTEQASLTAGSLNADLLPSTDVSAYAGVSLHINANAYSGTLSFQGSNDNSQFNVVEAYLISTTGATAIANATTGVSQIWFIPRFYRYIRVRMTAYTSGTANATAELQTTVPSWLTMAVNATQFGAWTIQPGNTQNTTPWLQQGPTSNSTAAANAGTGKAIKASAGALWSVVVTALGTAATSLYDNASAASGTALLTIPASAAVGSIYSFPGGAPAANGIFADQVANAPSITVYYR